MQHTTDSRAEAISRTPGHDVSRVPEDGRLARMAYRDLRLAETPGVNILLAGSDAVTGSLLEMLLQDLRAPIATWSPGEPLALPPAALGGTIILHNVGALTQENQHDLFGWLHEAVGRTRVVSTTSTNLLSHVQAGIFLEALYYRLNTVYLDVTTSHDPSKPLRHL